MIAQFDPSTFTAYGISGLAAFSVIYTVKLFLANIKDIRKDAIQKIETLVERNTDAMSRFTHAMVELTKAITEMRQACKYDRDHNLPN